LNQSGSFVLCKSYQSGKPSPSIDQIQYMVFERVREELLFQETQAGGSVDWYSEEELIIKEIPGIIQTGENQKDFTFLLNVISKEKRKMNASK